MNIGEEPKNLSSLNVFTFIKEIYASIKNFNKKIDKYNTDMNNNHELIKKIQENCLFNLNRNYELLQNIHELINDKNKLDSNLKNSLENKLSNLISENLETNQKLQLNLQDLSFGNIVDNDYTFDDINNSLNTSCLLNNLNSDNLLVNINNNGQKINNGDEDNNSDEVKNNGDEDNNGDEEDNNKDNNDNREENNKELISEMNNRNIKEEINTIKNNSVDAITNELNQMKTLLNSNTKISNENHNAEQLLSDSIFDFDNNTDILDNINNDILNNNGNQDIINNNSSVYSSLEGINGNKNKKNIEKMIFE